MLLLVWYLEWRQTPNIANNNGRINIMITDNMSFSILRCGFCIKSDINLYSITNEGQVVYVFFQNISTLPRKSCPKLSFVAFQYSFYTIV